MSYLILVRHGRSEWNDKGLWTGFADPPLNDEGRQEAHRAAASLIGLPIDFGFTSKLIRAKETLSIIFSDLSLNVPVEEDIALNERNYGIYTGKNKWQIKKEIGDETFNNLRRGWDFPIPEGESLKEVYNRVIPYFKNKIFPKIEMGKNCLISASGNSLRTIIKHIEDIPDDKISGVEIGTGELWIYNIDSKGKVVFKEIRSKNDKKV